MGHNNVAACRPSNITRSCYVTFMLCVIVAAAEVESFCWPDFVVGQQVTVHVLSARDPDNIVCQCVDTTNTFQTLMTQLAVEYAGTIVTHRRGKYVTIKYLASSAIERWNGGSPGSHPHAAIEKLG